MPKFLNNFRSSTLLPLGGAIAFAGLASYICYKLFQKDEDDPPLEIFPIIKLTTCELKLPRNAIGAVIGRQGSNIKMIEGKTSTSIKFKEDDENNNNKICIIRGKIEKVEKAKELILESVRNVPVLEEENFEIPNTAVGTILDRNGKMLDRIQRISGAKLNISWDNSKNGKMIDLDTKLVHMKGTKEQLKRAKLIISEKIEEAKQVKEMIKHSVNKLSQRSKYYQINECNGEDKEEDENSSHSDNCSALSTYEAFVSAVETASHFWVQMLGPKMIELDQLVVEMSEYYTDESNRENFNVFKFQPGDVIAAKFVDGLWYRGLLCSHDRKGEKLDVYFVDFGDSDRVDFDDVSVLRTDFLKLGFQAIECYLADVDLESCGSDEAIEVFEELSHCAQWKPVLIDVVGYKQEKDTTYPLVRIIDKSGEQDVHIGEELVKRNLVKWSESKLVSMSSSLTSEDPKSAEI